MKGEADGTNPIPLYISKQHESHCETALRQFLQPRALLLKERDGNKRDENTMTAVLCFLFFFVPPTVQQTSWGLSHISKPLTLKFKVQLVGVLQHTRGAGGGGGGEVLLCNFPSTSRQSQSFHTACS